MAIGTTAAIIGSAVVGAGASALSASKNSKAINQATEAQTESNAASLALQADIYGQNKETLSPFVARGNAAGEQMNALLGLGGAMRPINGAQPIAGGQNQPQSNALALSRGGTSAANNYGLGDGSVFTGNYGGGTFTIGGERRPVPMGYEGGDRGMPGPIGGFNGGTYNFNGTQATAANQPAAGATPQQAAGDAFDIFRNSTGYQFRLGQGMDAINSGYAGAGTLQSGAAMKAINEYGQNFASNEFGNYMGYLGQQQGTGLSAAGAQAGVGLNYANNVSNLNQQNANALSNAAVARANNSNALIGGISNGIGTILGGI